MGAGSSKEFDYEAQLKADKKQYSVELPESSGFQEGDGPTRRAIGHENKELPSTVFGDTDFPVGTVWDAFARSVAKHSDDPYLGERNFEKDGVYEFITYSQTNEIIKEVMGGMTALGDAKGDNVGIFSINRSEWSIAALSCYGLGCRAVALYATLGLDAVEYIIEHAEVKTVFVSKANLKTLLDALPDLKGIKSIVQFDADGCQFAKKDELVDEADVKKAEEHGVKLVGLSKLREMGKENFSEVSAPDVDDIAYIMYTSGTTGKPKGVMLSHRNIIAAVASIKESMGLDNNAVHISYLPMAHIFEVATQTAVTVLGARIGFFQGDIKQITSDLAALRPTFMCGVPRVFVRIYQKVTAGVQQKSCPIRFLFGKGFGVQAHAVRTGGARSHFYDNKVFIPLRTRLGLDRCRLIITGAAPTPPYLIEFLKVVIGADVCQGYGMTESAAGLTVTTPSDLTIGHVGGPIACCEIKLRSVPEMNYLVTDTLPRGEIMARGPNVFKGYYKNEEATNDTVDKDGWLSTGDIGRWNPNGTLSIIDRRKNIFKLSQGEYVAAEKIETVYGKSPMVGQVWVYGNSFKPFVVAVVVPSWERVVEVAQSNGWMSEDDPSAIGMKGFPEKFEEVSNAHKAEIKDMVFSSMKGLNKSLKGFEKVRDIIMEFRIDDLGVGFNEANECMTPTFKLRRPFLLKRYYTQLRECYKANGEAPKSDEKWPGAPEA